MSRLMVLGAGVNQIPLIEAAKKNNYTVIVCDYSEKAPGVKLADEFCCVSIMDKNGVLEAAKEKSIDGIISNSEPAMPIVSYVGNKIGLPSNKYEIVSAMTNKYAFRSLLKEKGFAVPEFGIASTLQEAEELFNCLNKPLMVKPAESSGSRGVKKINSFSDLEKAYKTASSYSRNDKVILEEFIDNTCGYLIAGDIFIYQKEVVFWGMMNSLRGEEFPMNPLGELYPASLSEEQEKAIKAELNRAAQKLEIEFSAINIEIVVGSDGKIYFIELNPRNGGNRIPEALYYATGFDIFDATVRAAVGDIIQPFTDTNNGVTATYMVHSDVYGTLKNVSFSDSLKPCIKNYFPDVEYGNEIEPFVNSDKRLGVLVMQFASVADRDETVSHIKEQITIETL